MYILCKKNILEPLKKIVGMVHRQGSIEIASLMLCTPHLLPSRTKKHFRGPRSFKSSIVNGYLTVETAGSLLSHRKASRPGDDIAIWSLLLDDTVYQNAKAFWRSRQGQTLSTGFLVSSVPRLKKSGLGWVPSAPTAPLLDSTVGIILKDGFSANWFMYDFIGPRIGAKALSSYFDIDMEPEDNSCRVNLQEVRHRFLRGYLWGALLRPGNTHDWKPTPDRGDINRTLVVVCGTNRRFGCPLDKNDDIYWRWRGVYEWDMAEPLPKFEWIKDVLLV